MSVQVIDTEKLNKLEKEITEYLYERNHEINRNLVADLAFWAYSYGGREFMDGQFADSQITMTSTSYRTEPIKKPNQPLKRRTK